MLVIIHGWSDGSASFRKLGRTLVERGVATEVAHVQLGDYVSMDDQVTFKDLTVALDRAWRANELPRTPRSVDVVVHSTGGLVIRDWMTATSTPTTTPIRRLLMLAPANFGSPLAHKGRSFIGRVVKGYKSDKPFQTGAQILKGLELASPYSWHLAQRDLFGADTWYGPGNVLCTVLVGNSGYSGISAAANENGTDGTVRVSTANLNSARLEMDFSANPDMPRLDWRTNLGRSAFARINQENHSTIAMKDRGPKSAQTLKLIVRALQVTDQSFEGWCDELEAIAADERLEGADSHFRQGYQNTVIHLEDDLGQPIDDFFFEVFAQRADNAVDYRLTAQVQDAVETVHCYADDASFRSLLFNVDALDQSLDPGNRQLNIAVTAEPDIRMNRNVGYSTFGYDDIGSIRLSPDLRHIAFRPDRTVLVTLKLRRIQDDRLFTFRPLG